MSEREGMQFEYDKEADAGYVGLADGKIATTEQAHGQVLLDFDSDGYLLGVEVLGLGR